MSLSLMTDTYWLTDLKQVSTSFDSVTLQYKDTEKGNLRVLPGSETYCINSKKQNDPLLGSLNHSHKSKATEAQDTGSRTVS